MDRVAIAAFPTVARVQIIRLFAGNSLAELFANPDADKLSFKMPSKEEQTAIGSVLSSIDAKIEALSKNLQYLVSEKSALMQQLLNGKRRVKIKEEDAADA